MLSLEALPAAGSVPSRARFPVLGIPVDAVQIPDAVRIVAGWVRDHERGRYVAVTGMHGVTEARHDPALRAALMEADLVVPDGKPLVWLGRIHGLDLRRRVYGPELMLEFCRSTAGLGLRHFLYGGAPGVAERLADRLTKEFPGVVIAGTMTPPFRRLSEAERDEAIATINGSGADVLWVGLSTPKQEKWMWRFSTALDVPVMLGVGAAFDLNTGRVRQAPPWMREHGFEWLYRLMREPRRLWRRYLLRGPEFVACALLELCGLRKYRS